jgi:hypothetical protein
MLNNNLFSERLNNLPKVTLLTVIGEPGFAPRSFGFRICALNQHRLEFIIEIVLC